MTAFGALHGYGSVSEYVEALKVMNHLDSDTIHAGQYLMIAYEKL